MSSKRYTTPNSRKIEPSDLRVECWTCGGHGKKTVIVDNGARGHAGYVRGCDAPGCKGGLRLPRKVDL